MNRPLFTAQFWIDVLERVIKTFCQTWGALLVADGTSILDVGPIWTQVQVALIAALVALLMGVAGAGIGSSATAAWLPEGPDTERGSTSLALVAGTVALVAVALIFFLVGGQPR